MIDQHLSVAINLAGVVDTTAELKKLQKELDNKKSTKRHFFRVGQMLMLDETLFHRSGRRGSGLHGAGVRMTIGIA